ncbi:IclR family transcriptional regulator [Arvimicrobium flavum]|uniref:IclR family transcriptional regulator n=1 Tax=Arvimicrobium flavum TaxID=3393320 RepID=UPI00237C1A46|nr:IclR family transcriptional regulator [Mesorhizobium shangrilense]
MRPRRNATKAGEPNPQSGHDEMDQVEPAKDPHKVEALERGLLLLQAFRRGDQYLGNAELAARVLLPKATVSRLAYTLTAAGFLVFDPESRRYSLGPSAIAVGSTALANTSVRDVARPYLEQLANDMALNVGLGMQDRLQIMYIDAYEGNPLIGLRLYSGTRLPLPQTSMGRAILFAYGPQKREEILGQVRETQTPEEWQATRAGLDQAMRDLEELGYCSSAGEWRPEIHAAAAPIRLPDGRVYALNAGGPAYLVPIERLGEIGLRLRSIAEDIERAMGGDGAPPDTTNFDR